MRLLLTLCAAACGVVSAFAQCPPIALSPAGSNDLPLAFTNQPYPTQVFTATGGTAPYAFSFEGTLPFGLRFEDGVLSGRPGEEGTFDFTVTATDANGCAGSQSYRIFGASPFLSRAGYTVTSGNGILEPGECNNLDLRLTNPGPSFVDEFQATLFSNTGGVRIVQGASTYPAIPVNGTRANATPFVVSIDPTVPCFSQAILVLRMTRSSDGLSIFYPFVLPIGQTANNYTIVPNGTASLPAGTLVPGSQRDDGLVPLTLPFGISLYGNHYPAGSVILACTNGNLQFDPTGSRAFANENLPATGSFTGGTFPARTATLFPFWDDLLLTDASAGIFTTVAGEAPNRTFTVQWRGSFFNDRSSRLRFAVQFTEGSLNFDFIYANAPGTSAGSATIGAQAGTTGPLFTQYAHIRTAPLTGGQRLTASLTTGVCNVGQSVCPAAPSFTSELPPATAYVGVPYTHTFTASGAPAPTFQITAGALPSGLTLSPDGQISGVPTAPAAPGTLSVTASNGLAPNATQTFNLRVFDR